MLAAAEAGADRAGGEPYRASDVPQPHRRSRAGTWALLVTSRAQVKTSGPSTPADPVVMASCLISLRLSSSADWAGTHPPRRARPPRCRRPALCTEADQGRAEPRRRMRPEGGVDSPAAPCDGALDVLKYVHGARERRHDDRLRGLRRNSRDRPQHGLPSEAKGPASQVVFAARSPQAIGQGRRLGRPGSTCAHTARRGRGHGDARPGTSATARRRPFAACRA